MTNTNVERLVEEFDRKFANATYSPDGRGGVECHCHEMKDWLRSALSQARQEGREEMTPDWKAYREAYEELNYFAEEIGKFVTYLSMEQKRELEALQEQIRSLKRDRQTFALTTEGK